MTDFDQLFSQGEANGEKLLRNGFVKTAEGYYRETPLLDFLLRVTVAEAGGVRAELFDPESDAPYTVHLVREAEGSFVGEVRRAYETALTELAEACFDRAAFKSRLTKDTIQYALERYGENIEYLWEDTPDCGIIRRSDNRKWYAVFMQVAGNKVGLPTDRLTEVVNLRVDRERVGELVLQRGFAPAYHMNKKTWISVLLDGSVALSAVETMLDASRESAWKNKRR